jgi:hypothetical protein
MGTTGFQCFHDTGILGLLNAMHNMKNACGEQMYLMSALQQISTFRIARAVSNVRYILQNNQYLELDNYNLFDDSDVSDKNF